MPRHLTVTRSEGESTDDFAKRVSEKIDEHFSDSAPVNANIDVPAEEPATDA